MKVFLILALIGSLGLNFALGRAVAELENTRYGLLVGMCTEKVEGKEFREGPVRFAYIDCLESTPTRTSDLYHLAYAIGLL